MKFIAQEWDYLNEGNANVVLKYTGNDPVLKGKILRLQKTGSECNGRFLIDYQKYLVTRLFGSEFCTASVRF
jgi:inositol-pentakisphosphate 2-kinase